MRWPWSAYDPLDDLHPVDREAKIALACAAAEGLTGAELEALRLVARSTAAWPGLLAHWRRQNERCGTPAAARA